MTRGILDEFIGFMEKHMYFERFTWGLETIVRYNSLIAGGDFPSLDFFSNSDWFWISATMAVIRMRENTRVSCNVFEPFGLMKLSGCYNVTPPSYKLVYKPQQL